MIHTAQKIKFSIKYFFSKRDQIRRKLWIWSHLLKKSLLEIFIFCAVTDAKKYIYTSFSDFNIKMYENNKYIFHENNTVCKKSVFADTKKHQFCTMHDLRQLIQCPTRVTCTTVTLIYHILAGFPSRVPQKRALT